MAMIATQRTAFNYPESKRCEAELHVSMLQWMDNTNACSYSGLNTYPDTFVVVDQFDECTECDVDFTFYEA